MSFKLYKDAMGRKVATGTSTGSISVAELREGLYLLQIKGDHILKTEKIIVN